jgi:2-isopropylmalate synthase
VRRITVFDTTLRDGDQAAGFAFSVKQKLAIARELAEAGVDIIETGFPLSSSADFDVCRLAARELAGTQRKVLTAVLCRGRLEDIRETARVFEGGLPGVLHISLPVSKNHIGVKLGKTEKDVLKMAAEAVSFAAGLASDVELGGEDASRADPAFLLDYCAAAVTAGASRVNIADTVGAMTPEKFYELVDFLFKGIPQFSSGKAVLSVHCHNDLGLACANTLAAIKAGCGQIEVSVSGIGERAGNAALEEVYANLEAHPDEYAAYTGIEAEKIGGLVSLTAEASGAAFLIKPLAGWNTRAHSSGIHQQGLSRDGETYTLGVLERINLVPERIVLSRHSGQAGVQLFAKRYCGLDLDEDALSRIASLIKAPGRGSTGITEFLCMLAGLEKPAAGVPPPLVCVSFSAAHRLSVNETGETPFVRAAALVAPFRSAEKSREAAAEAESESAAVLELAAAFSGIRLALKKLRINGCGNRIRLYAEISAAGKLYALERSGASSGMLLFQCCLDVINAQSRCRSL